MNRKFAMALIAIYAIGFVVTYGRAWHTSVDSADVKPYQNENSMRSMEALASAAVFPLYWSVQAWK